MLWFDLLPQIVCYDDAPAGEDPPADDKPADGEAGDGEKLLTQEQFNKALAEDRRKHQAQLKKMEANYAELLQNKKLTDEERSKLEEAREDLLKQLRSKEEQAKYELKKSQEEFTTKLTAAEKRALEAENKLRNFVIDRALLDAALPEAYNPTQVLKILKGNTKLIQDESGNDTVMIDFEDIDSDTGEPMISQRTPKDAIERMKQLSHVYGNLFKSNVAGGIGGTGNADSGKPVNFKKMTSDEYMRRLKDDPKSLGL